MAGDTPPKLHGASEALKYVELSGTYRINGVICSRIEVRDRAQHPSSHVYNAKSLQHYGTRVLVYGTFWIPSASGIIVGWELA